MLAATATTLIGIAAIVSALGGLVTTILTLRKSQKQEDDEVHRQLKESREEVEALARELHEIKMRSYE